MRRNTAQADLVSRKVSNSSLDRVLDLPIRIKHQAGVGVVGEPDRQPHLELTTPSLVENAALQAGLQDVQLGLAHRALQAEQQPVVEVRRVVHTIFVADDRARHGGQLEQALPVGVVARQPRDLQAQHDAGMTHRHLGDQVLEAVAIAGLGARQAQVVVDDMHALDGPAHRDRTIAQGVLALGALGVLEHLALRGLAHVDEGVAPQMVGVDLQGVVSRHTHPSTA